MKKLLLAAVLFQKVLFAGTTNYLSLSWNAPAGFSSTMYMSTNLGSSWLSLGPVNAPYVVPVTNSVAYFQVVVMPTNQVNGTLIFAGDPNIMGIKPTFTNAGCVGYIGDSSFSLYSWNTNTQNWRTLISE